MLVSLIALALIFLFTVFLGRYLRGVNIYWLFELFHFLAGFFLAGLFIGFINSDVIVVSLVILVGLLWELWEYSFNKSKEVRRISGLFGIKKVEISGPDTVLDLILDTLGAIIYIWLVK